MIFFYGISLIFDFRYILLLKSNKIPFFALLCTSVLWGCNSGFLEDETFLKTCSPTFNKLSLSAESHENLLVSPSAVLQFIRQQNQKIIELEQQVEEKEELVHLFFPERAIRQKRLAVAVKLRDLAIQLNEVQLAWQREALIEEMDQLTWALQYDDSAIFTNQECKIQISIHDQQPPSLESNHRVLHPENVFESVRLTDQTDLGIAYEDPAIRHDLENIVFHYENFKTSLGRNIGFEFSDDQQRLWKAKIAFRSNEVFEPLAARIFWAMGYHTDEPYHVKQLQIAHTSRIEKDFLDFSSKIESIAPFLSGVILKDGRLLDWMDMSDTEKETQYQSLRHIIDVLLFTAVVEQRELDQKIRVGPWFLDFHGLVDRQAIRSLGIFMPWIGNYDLIYDNFRLVLERTDQGFQTRLVLHDLGRSFSLAKIGLNVQKQDDGALRLDFVETIGHYYEAFHRIHRENALWAAELMNLFSEQQLMEAAIASGYDDFAAEKIVAQLLSSRDHFVEMLQ